VNVTVPQVIAGHILVTPTAAMGRRGEIYV